MKDLEQFDDLARRKLDERQFSFQEADWERMETLLDARRRDRKGLYWSLAIIAVLLSGGVLWWIGRPHASTTEARSVADARPDARPHEAVAPTVPTSPMISHENDPTARQQVEPARGTTQQEGYDQPRTDLPEARTSGMTDRVVSHTTRTVTDGEDAGTTPTAPDPRTSVTVAADTPPAVTAEARSDDQRTDRTPVNVNSDVPEDEAPTASEPVAPSGPRIPSSEVKMEPTPTPGTATSSAEIPVSEQVPVRYGETLVADSVARMDTDTKVDSSAIVAPRPEGTLGSSWELTLFGGPGATFNGYGGSLADQGDALRGGLGMTFGAEAMHMGEKFGWGTGLHYASYTEHLDRSEIVTETTELKNTYSLTTVDTTVIGVVDTIMQGGVTYYVTEWIDTTVMVLDTQVDTIVHRDVGLEARTRTNVIGYLEIPVLFDVHGGHGPWSFGLRAGPTVGLLIGRRGELPNTSQDGYTDLRDQQFRDLMIGMMVRGYVRYRFAPHWSIGLAPMYRALLLDTYAGDPRSRKVSSLGGVLSLSYRLR